ncbi:hypothetical protein AB0B01_11625 [Streptomyces sp. NPDC044571]|uniref:hypothetical protein n=1 Tax=Streptomyces sp. NPDC044571 TaxID=3155371 RepID=UPI0033D65A1F
MALSFAAYRNQRRRTSLELARSLHADLTSGHVQAARDVLGTLVRYREQGSDLVAARSAYFTLLWCFERIWAGREVIVRDEGEKSPSCRFLDEMIHWHVRNWARDLPMIKEAIQEALGTVHDEDALHGFRQLRNKVLTGEELTEVRLSSQL